MNFAYTDEVLMRLAAHLPEVDRRMPGLVREFGKPSGRPIISGCNVDTRFLPREARLVVSTTHSMVTCHVCGDDMWLGPFQKQMEGTRICYVCLALLAYQTAEQEQPAVVMLNADAHLNPRRY